MNFELVVYSRHTLLRFPTTRDELQSNLTDESKMVFKSTFSFKGLEGAASCDLQVVDNNGTTFVDQRLVQVDKIDRKYSVTTGKYTR